VNAGDFENNVSLFLLGVFYEYLSTLPLDSGFLLWGPAFVNAGDFENNVSLFLLGVFCE
jgi:hypothetical protein